MFDDLKIMLDTEMIDYEDILSGSKYDDLFQQDPDSLSFVDLEHQYWESISIILDKMKNLVIFLIELIS